MLTAPLICSSLNAESARESTKKAVPASNAAFASANEIRGAPTAGVAGALAAGGVWTAFALPESFTPVVVAVWQPLKNSPVDNKSRTDKNLVFILFLPKCLKHFIGVSRNVNLVKNFHYLAIAVDEKGFAVRAHIFFAVHRFLAPNSVILNDLFVGVGE